MKKTKYITINKKNIQLIAFKLKQVSNRLKAISIQNFYRNRFSIFLPQTPDTRGINRIITQSNVSYFTTDNSIIELETKMRKSPFIRVVWPGHGELIKIGDKIRITTNRVYILQPPIFPTPQKPYPLEIWKQADYHTSTEYGKREKAYEERYQKEYWESLDMEEDEYFEKYMS